MATSVGTGYKSGSVRCNDYTSATRRRFVMNSVSYDLSEQRIPGQPAPSTAVGSLLGASPAMQEVFRLVERVGPTEANVLLTGESGSGKELAAQSIHERSARRDGPFVAINCGAIPAGLIEAELFGYEKGSFTGAVRAHAGVFAGPQGGPLLLAGAPSMRRGMATRALWGPGTRKICRAPATAGDPRRRRVE